MSAQINAGQFSLSFRQVFAILSLFAITTGVFVPASNGQAMKGTAAKSAGKLTDDQRVLHVLNRLGFGARPGDLARVKAMGLDRYIEQQLNPEKIDDSASEARLQNLDTLRMSTAELYEKYPQPGQLLKQLQRRGALPAELAAARDNRQQNEANPNQPKTEESKPGEMQRPANPNAANSPAANDANPMNNAQYRQAVMEYFKENNLRPAQFLTGELQMSRILRAVYSERQLQEVMVDFWTNHFNVFAGQRRRSVAADFLRSRHNSPTHDGQVLRITARDC